MPITIRFQKTDENGNTYYEDTNGNRIDIEPSTEEIAAREAKLERLRAEALERMEARQQKASPFLLKSLGNLQKPKARKSLWTPYGSHFDSAQCDLTTRGTVYWAERELCILAGDNGVGKSLVALQVAKELVNAGFDSAQPDHLSDETVKNPLLRGVPNEVKAGCVLVDPTHLPSATPRYSSQEEISCLNRVLYIDWELTEEDFVQRWGNESVPENFFWAGFNTDGEMPQHVPDKIEWLLQNFATTVKETEANILIIDQPDRLHLSPQKWNEFLTKLKALMREFNLSVMLVLSNKSRHTGRPCGLNNIPKGNILVPVADSVVMLCQNQRRTCERYFKVLKNRHRAAAENLEFVDIIEVQETNGFLIIETWGRQSEKSMLPPNAAERKNQKIMEAEKLWNSGLSCLEVAEQMYVAESTVKGWLRPLLYPPQPLPTSREGLILPLRVGGDVEQRETEGVLNG